MKAIKPLTTGFPTDAAFRPTFNAILRGHPHRREIGRDFLAMMARVDREWLEELQRRHASARQKAASDSQYKYLDVPRYVLEKLLLAYELQLESGLPRRILDIGMGAGHFPLVCRFYGHEVIGIDIENALYAEIAECLGVARAIVPVRPLEALPEFGGTFDLITACEIKFNDKPDRDGRRDYWSLAEWRFLLDDLLTNHLRYPGTLYLQLNVEQGRHPLGYKRTGFNKELMSMAARNGARVDRRRGVIRFDVSAPLTIR